jgi:hypothetical protein
VVIENQRRDYWAITQKRFSIDPQFKGKETGIIWVTISDRIVPYLIQYSVLTFYISVVLVVGRLIRTTLFEVGADQIFIKRMSKPDQLLLL